MSDFLRYFRNTVNVGSSTTKVGSEEEYDIIIRPKIKGHFDIHTRSVWITDDTAPDSDTSSSSFSSAPSAVTARKRLFFEQGFFGKGSLSRSDPSWKVRRIKHLREQAEIAKQKAEQEAAALDEEKEGDETTQKKEKKVFMTAEEVTRQRRLERKQFKIDRAQAMLNASLAAEAILKTAAEAEKNRSEQSETEDPETPPQNGEVVGGGDAEDNDNENDDDSVSVISRSTRTGGSTPVGSSKLRQDLADNADVTVPDVEGYKASLPEGVTRLTPQTFLVRPERPAGSQPNRGKPKRKPRPAATPTIATPTTTTETGTGTATATVPQQTVVRPPPSFIKPEEEVVPDKFAAVEDMEHLQLNLEETFFLGWALGCLTVFDKRLGVTYTPEALFKRILTLPQALKNPMLLPSPLSPLPMDIARRPDHPFLVSYAAYHHYRSLGWVLKTGIKFCCDWLLYKKGPVFSHAEFALLVLPHYTDKEDEKNSPFKLNNGDQMSWQWLNTVNRVNTQVKKTLILAYVTIPSMKDVDIEKDFDRPELLLGKYKVTEIVIRRFVPARMRD